jgi:signal transduction histidine kinase
MRPALALYRFLKRYRGRVGKADAHRAEWVLAVGRLILAGVAILAVLLYEMGPSDLSVLDDLVAATYFVYSLAVFIFLTRSQPSSRAFRYCVHAGDALWITLICASTGASNSPFLVFILFVLVAAAYRWGLLETVVTTVSILCVLPLETVMISIVSRQGQGWHLLQGHLGFHSLVTKATSLVVLGYLIGFLAEKEKRLRAETQVITHLISNPDQEPGFRQVLESCLRSMGQLFGSRKVLLALQERTSLRAFFWELNPTVSTRSETVDFHSLRPLERERYFFPIPEEIGFAVRFRRSPQGVLTRLMALGPNGERLPKDCCIIPKAFLSGHQFRLMHAVSFSCGEEWSGRLFLFDPRGVGDREDELRFLQSFVQELSLTVYAVYLLRCLPSRAGKDERARLARELHDGIVQTLTGVDMQIDVLRRSADGDSAVIRGELSHIQQVLRRETAQLRRVMQRLRPPDPDPRQLVDCLAEMVVEFGRDTGIRATFVSEFQEVALPPQVCREVMLILQEALFNVRKHSGAKKAQVHFTSTGSQWKLQIEDDGRGFDFAGRRSLAELDATRKGPLVIRERLRSIGGELTVESKPGRGARLEILLPQRVYG